MNINEWTISDGTVTAKIDRSAAIFLQKQIDRASRVGGGGMFVEFYPEDSDTQVRVSLANAVITQIEYR